MQNFNGLKSAIDEKTLILTLKAHGFSAKEISEMTGLAYQSTYQRFSRDSGEFTPTLTNLRLSWWLDGLSQRTSTQWL